MFLLRLAPAPEKVECIWRGPPSRGLHRDSFFSDRRDGPCSQVESQGAARPRRRGPGKFVGALNRNQDSYCKCWLSGVPIACLRKNIEYLVCCVKRNPATLRCDTR